MRTWVVALVWFTVGVTVIEVVDEVTLEAYAVVPGAKVGDKLVACHDNDRADRVASVEIRVTVIA